MECVGVGVCIQVLYYRVNGVYVCESFFAENIGAFVRCNRELCVLGGLSCVCVAAFMPQCNTSVLLHTCRVSIPVTAMLRVQHKAMVSVHVLCAPWVHTGLQG